MAATTAVVGFYSTQDGTVVASVDDLLLALERAAMCHDRTEASCALRRFAEQLGGAAGAHTAKRLGITPPEMDREP